MYLNNHISHIIIKTIINELLLTLCYSGTQENTHVHEQLSKAWGVLEPKIEEYGLLLLRYSYS